MNEFSDEKIKRLESEIDSVKIGLKSQEHRPLKIFNNWRRILTVDGVSKEEKNAVYSSTISWWLSTRKTVIVISLLGGLTSLISLFIGWQVWRTAENQNELLKVQNEKINIQNHLMESERRSSMMMIFDNVIGEIDEELHHYKDSLSSKLVARIGVLSHSFRPYFSLEDSVLDKNKYSYERGVLFNFLFSSKYLNDFTQKEICDVSNFQDLKLIDGNIKGFNTSHESRYPGVNFGKSKFQNVTFLDSKFKAYCENSYFQNCNFESGHYEIVSASSSFKDCDFKFSRIELAGAASVFENCSFQGIDKDIVKLFGRDKSNRLLTVNWDLGFLIKNRKRKFGKDTVLLRNCLFNNCKMNLSFESDTSSILQFDNCCFSGVQLDDDIRKSMHLKNCIFPDSFFEESYYFNDEYPFSNITLDSCYMHERVFNIWLKDDKLDDNIGEYNLSRVDSITMGKVIGNLTRLKYSWADAYSSEFNEFVLVTKVN